MTIKITVFRNVMSCSLVKRNTLSEKFSASFFRTKELLVRVVTIPDVRKPYQKWIIVGYNILWEKQTELSVS